MDLGKISATDTAVEITMKTLVNPLLFFILAQPVPGT